MAVTEKAPIAAKDKLLYRVPEAAEVLSISESTAYRLIRAGRLRTVMLESLRLVPRAAVEELVRRIEADDEAQGAKVRRLRSLS